MAEAGHPEGVSGSMPVRQRSRAEPVEGVND
jgi:hypothetical protein